MWTIIQSATYKAMQASVRSQVPRFDEVYESVEWALQRNPDSEEFDVGQGRVRLIKSRPLGGDVPETHFLFVYNEKTREVTLRFVVVVEPQGNGSVGPLLPDASGW